MEKIRRTHQLYKDTANRISTLSSYYVTESCLDAADLTAARLMLPTQFSHGVQGVSEYRSSSRKRVTAALAECGINYLTKNPILTCAVPGESGITLTILDGHHRGRLAPKFGIREIPSHILTPDQVIDVISQKPNEQITITDFANRLRVDIANALDSFIHVGYSRMPQIVLGAYSIADLTKRFSSF